VRVTAPSTTNSTPSAAGSDSGWPEPPPGETSTTYWLNVSAKPDSGLASTQRRVFAHPGRKDAVMSLSVRAGMTA
jgi:hypothetical protein